MNSAEVVASKTGIISDLVVVHGSGGRITRGTLDWNPASEQAIPPTPLPDELHIKCSTSGEDKVVSLAETKAVFFVKRQEGDQEHDEVKFFADVTPEYLWIRVRFADGEVLEGRTENSRSLLFAPGFWLQPFDTITNNSLVYIPKSSVVEFHVVGVNDTRQRKTEAN